MATEAEMIKVVQLIGMGLTSYAEKEKWDDQDFRIFYNVNPDWDRVHIVLVAKAFNGMDNYQCYQKVWQFLYQLFRRQPYQVEVMESLNLVVAGTEEAAKGGVYGVGPGYEEIGPGFKDFWSKCFVADWDRARVSTNPADRK
jgi:hypothetical protein